MSKHKNKSHTISLCMRIKLNKLSRIKHILIKHILGKYVSDKKKKRIEIKMMMMMKRRRWRRMRLEKEKKMKERTMMMVMIMKKKKLFVGCYMSQQHAGVAQGRIYSDNCTCCHTKTKVADSTFYLDQSRYTDTGLTSLSADPITSSNQEDSKWNTDFIVTGTTDITIDK